MAVGPPRGGRGRGAAQFPLAARGHDRGCGRDDDLDRAGVAHRDWRLAGRDRRQRALLPAAQAESRALMRAPTAPMSARPAALDLIAAMTLPMSLMEVAPVAATASLISASSSASVR